MSDPAQSRDRSHEPDALGTFARLSAPRLVGRDEELALILKSASRPPALVLVEGEAGVGKTRLVHDMLDHPSLAHHAKLVGHSDPLDEPLPLQPVVQALASAGSLPVERLSLLAGALRPLLPELAVYLPPPLEPLADARAERHRLLRAIVEVLDALGPAVLVFEDLHWADPTTLELLAFLVSHQPGSLTVVCTYRGEEMRSSAAGRRVLARVSPRTTRVNVTLAPLSEEEVKDLLAGILGTQEISREFVAYLHEKTGGLPFAIEELLRLMQERRDVVLKDGRWARRTLDALEVPAAVRESILERVARLSQDARAVVEACAVLSAAASEELLDAIAGQTAVRAGLGDAVASGVLQERRAGTYDFRHALARQAVYDSVPPPVRRRMHVRAARALETLDASAHARIAHHYLQGGDERRWASRARAAAQRAVELHDYVAACRLLEGVLAIVDDPAERGEVAFALGAAALDALEHARVAPVLESVLDSVDRADAGTLRVLIALLTAQGGDASRAYAEAERALADVEDPRLRVRAMLLLAMPLVTEGTRTRHLAWLERAERELGDDDRLRAAFVFNKAGTLLTFGDASQLSLIERIPPLDERERRHQLLRGSLVLSYSALYVGDYTIARRWLDEHIALSATTRDDRLASGTTSTQAVLEWATGEWDGLEQRVYALAEETQDVPCSFVDVQAVLGQLLLASGRARDAEEVLRATVDSARRAGMIPLLAIAASGLARLLLARGATRKAYDEASAVIELLRAKDMFVWGAEIWDPAVDALLAMGQVEEADALMAELAVAIDGLHCPAAHAALLWGRARLARARDEGTALDAFTEAKAAWSELPRPYDAARIDAERATVLLGAGDGGAEGAALDALARLSELGAEWDAARLKRTMREYGVGLPQPWRGGRKGYGDELSPREAEVAALAAEGKTNKEIAILLFLSPRTVENQLSSAMRKLGVRSRKELAQSDDAAEN